MIEDLKLLRKSLWPFSFLYGVATALRNWTFDAGLRKVHQVDVPVVAVGNLTAGGTGKTPLVAWLVERALQAGLRPGVLARGYGRAEGAALNDEGMLLARRFPGLDQVQDPDRVRGAQALVDAGVDLIVVDDGFQHRRLHRDWDLLCIDTARPFAGGMLPVGDLREYPKGMRRASAVILTRAGAYTPESVAARVEELRPLLPKDCPVFTSDHVPGRLLDMPAGADLGLEAIQDQPVLLLSGIGRPESFAATVERLGGRVVDHIRRPDHHLHTEPELREAAARAAGQGARLVVTEKDEVKWIGDAPRLVLEMQLQFLGRRPSTGATAATFLSFPANERR